MNKKDKIKIASYQKFIVRRASDMREEEVEAIKPRLIACPSCNTVCMTTNTKYRRGDKIIRPSAVEPIKRYKLMGFRVDNTAIGSVICPECEERIISDRGTVKFVS